MGNIKGKDTVEEQNNIEAKTRNRKNKIIVIVALFIAVSSWAAIQNIYYAIYMIAMDVTDNAYEFGSMPKFFIGASMMLFATAIFLTKSIIELIHTTKRSTIEGDKN